MIRNYTSVHDVLYVTTKTSWFLCKLSFSNPLKFINNKLYIKVYSTETIDYKYDEVIQLSILVCKLVKK